ncbi:hypothetical protein OJAV_G00017140 [Oryzias javanicus]|uniref:Uncharacterized protein n=1 Tax=Oryzias javanicus TaxID=123683 RepID=A0A437DLL9_ORYJA|nr:hypothetical protein OJAV_G00017140 [Oryzias javanicus]
MNVSCSFRRQMQGSQSRKRRLFVKEEPAEKNSGQLRLGGHHTLPHTMVGTSWRSFLWKFSAFEIKQTAEMNAEVRNVDSKHCQCQPRHKPPRRDVSETPASRPPRTSPLKPSRQHS